MAASIRNLLNRDRRYFARLVIPKELRPFMNGKTELRTALCPDYRTALKKLPGAVADLQHNIALGERRADAAGEKSVTTGRYPLATGQSAFRTTMISSRKMKCSATRDRTGPLFRLTTYWPLNCGVASQDSFPTPSLSNWSSTVSSAFGR